MIDKLKLGIVYNEHKKIVNHRSLIKVFLNPFLRLVGFQIATVYDKKSNELYGVKFLRCRKIKDVIYKYKLEKNWIVKRRRMLI